MHDVRIRTFGQTYTLTDALFMPARIVGREADRLLDVASRDVIAMMRIRRLMLQHGYPVHRIEDGLLIRQVRQFLHRGRFRLLSHDEFFELRRKKRMHQADPEWHRSQALEPSRPTPMPPPARARTQEIELEYTRADGSGVAGAAYHIRGDLSVDGTLDGQGRVLISDVPMDVARFTFFFDGDPESYQPTTVPEIPASLDAVREAAIEALDALGNALASAGEWTWGAAKGDFNQNQTTSQLVVNTLLRVIPVVDQVLDVRDLIAGVGGLIDYYQLDQAEQTAQPEVLGLSAETWRWLGLFLIALGAIPILGSVIKGVLKGLIQKLRALGGPATALSTAQLRSIWEGLVAILNHLGVGHAHAWLKQAVAKIPEWMDQAATTLRGALDTVAQKLDQAKALAQRLPGEGARAFAERITVAQRALGTAYTRLDAMKARINMWLSEQLQKVLSGKHTFEAEGAPGSLGARAQRAEAPPQLAPPASSRRIVPAREKLAELSDEELASVRAVDTFKTHGVSTQRAKDFLETTEEGQELLRQVAKSARPGTPDDQIFRRALGLVQTGEDVPVMTTISSPLVKIVPEGGGVTGHSPFWTTPEEYARAQATDRPLSDVFGLPAISDAARYDAHEIRPVGEATVFISKIAPTEELGGKLRTDGGAIQVVVPDRSQFTPTGDPFDTINDNLPPNVE